MLSPSAVHAPIGGGKSLSEQRKPKKTDKGNKVRLFEGVFALLAPLAVENNFPTENADREEGEERERGGGRRGLEGEGGTSAFSSVPWDFIL